MRGRPPGTAGEDGEHPALRDRRRGVAREQGLRRRNRALWGLCGLAGIAMLYWLLTGPILSINAVSVGGYDRPDRERVIAALESAAATGTVVSLPRATMERSVAGHPWVESISVERRLPRSAHVQVVQARPIAVARSEDGVLTLISSRGRALERLESAPDLSGITLPGDAPGLGRELPDPWPEILLLPAVLPADVADSLRDLRLDEDGLVVARLDGGPELRLGRPDRLRVKARALGLVLGALPAEERERAEYIDLSVPEHPAVGGLGQVTAEGGVVSDELIDTDGNGIPDTPASVLYGDGPRPETADGTPDSGSEAGRTAVALPE